MDREKLVQHALRDPQRALIELDRIDCAESFHEFVRQAWHVLEPVHPFVDGWAVRAICDSLQAVTEGRILRLLINVPPGCTKSMTTSVLWAAWEWGPRKLSHHRFINASYEKGLATRDLVRCRDLLCSEWYQARWPIQLKDDQDQKTYYENGNTGWRLATSVGGALVGYRGDRFVVDDPHDVKRAESDVQREEALRWWTEVVPTRFNDQHKSARVLMMQRLHANDLSGHTLKTEGDDWVKLILPMEYEPDRHCSIPQIGFSDPRTEPGELLWPERFDADTIRRLKRSLSSKGGSYAVAGQLQQRPVLREGGMFAQKHVQYLDVPDSPIIRRVRGWDLAASTRKTSPWTVGVLMGITQRGQVIVLDVERFRAGPHALERKLKEVAKKDGYDVVQFLPQDPAAAGKVQKASYAALLTGYEVRFSPETGEKEDRAVPFAAQWEAGNVFLMRGAWNEAYVTEICEFPRGDFLDQGDASSRAYSWFVTHVDEDQIGTTPGLLTE